MSDKVISENDKRMIQDVFDEIRRNTGRWELTMAEWDGSKYVVVLKPTDKFWDGQ